MIQFSDGLVEDLDLIILGGYYGHGRFSGRISIFLMGLKKSTTFQSSKSHEFVSIVQVKTGLSDNDLKFLQDKLKPYWKDKKPHGISGPKVKI